MRISRGTAFYSASRAESIIGKAVVKRLQRVLASCENGNKEREIVAVANHVDPSLRVFFPSFFFSSLFFFFYFSRASPRLVQLNAPALSVECDMNVNEPWQSGIRLNDAAFLSRSYISQDSFKRRTEFRYKKLLSLRALTFMLYSHKRHCISNSSLIKREKVIFSFLIKIQKGDGIREHGTFLLKFSDREFFIFCMNKWNANNRNGGLHVYIFNRL